MEKKLDPYAPPSATLERPDSGENTSGMGKGHPLPDGIKGWSWGAFFLNWIWSIGNKTWIGMLALVPYVGFVMSIVLGFKGREWAWQNKRWDSVEHFNRVQASWSKWGVGLVVGVAIIGVLAAILIPALQQS